jgi:predicted ArsR family transcriptional regulator
VRRRYLARPEGVGRALAAFVAAGGSVQDAAEIVGIRPSTVKRHLADLRARSGLTTAELIYAGRAAGWLVVPSLEPS